MGLKDIIHIYDTQYRKLILIPIIVLILAIAQIGYQTATTGDFINKGVDLKGGITLTIPDADVDSEKMQAALQRVFTENDILVRTLKGAGGTDGVIIEADMDITDKDSLRKLLSASAKLLKKELTKEDFTLGLGSSKLGASFFKQTFTALVIAFIFMGIVVFIIFRSVAPSFAVILAAFSDIVITVAIVNLLGIKVSIAGIAAFLMLVGYSVDTDILLSKKVLQTKQGTVLDRVFVAMRTGLTMTTTTLAAVLIPLMFASSDTIRQIMIILFIGLIVDLMNTWIQNVALLRMFLDKKAKV